MTLAACGSASYKRITDSYSLGAATKSSLGKAIDTELPQIQGYSFNFREKYNDRNGRGTLYLCRI